MNRVVRTRVFAWVCTLILLVSGVPVMAQAKQPQKVAYTKVTGKTARKQFQKSLKAGSKKYVRKRASYPASYDLRTLGLVTPVKDQGYTGLCWAFAACASMESNALKQGLGTYDLSENHLAWFAYNSGSCPLPGLEGDTNFLVGTTEEDGQYVKSEWYNNGGGSDVASQSMMNGYGPVLESDSPVNVNVAEQTAPSTELASGHNVLTLKTTYAIPAKNSNAIKDAIMANGAVVVSINTTCMDEEYGDDFFNWDTNAEYYDGTDDMGTDHDVCIVGWDDNYSKENFGNKKPKNNGAWLLRNSWGTEWGNDGYFWISYEDYAVNQTTIYSYVVAPKDAYESIYQHDGGLVKAIMGKFSGAANVFTARKNEKIIAVTGLMDSCSGTVAIYENPGTKSPLGTKLTSQKFTVNHTGHVTIDLEKPVMIQKGMKFSVVMTFNKPIDISIDEDDPEEWLDDYKKEGNGNYYTDVTARAGESFVLNDSWESTGDDFNCCIKALALGAGMLASTPTSGNILLSWNEVKDATGYEVYRKTGAEEYALLTTVEKDRTTYVDETAEVGVSYDYKVVSKLSSGVGEEQSISAKAILFAPQKLTTKKTSKILTLKWGTVNKAVKYEVYRKVKGGSYKKVSTVKTATYKDKKVKKGKTYSYYVVAVATNGSKSAKSAVKTIRF